MSALEIIRKHFKDDMFTQLNIQDIDKAIELMLKNPMVKILYDANTESVCIVYKKRDHLAELTFISECKNGWGIVKSARKMQKYMKNNMNLYKLEMRTAKPAVTSLVKRLGWKEEGYREKSFNLDGKFVGEYEYGIVLGD